MKRFPVLALFALMAAALACNSAAPASTPEPTATLVLPTETPEPTDTPPPTETSTPLPTATPDAAATRAARATQSASSVLDELDKLLGSANIPYKEGQLVWEQTEPLAIRMTGPDYQIVDIDEDLTAANFIFKSDVRWEASGLLICGSVFRSEPNLLKGKQYQFVYLRLSGLPAWAIEVHEFGDYKNSPSDTRTAGAIDLANGATNQFVLVVQDDHFTLYLNGVRQGTYYDYSKQRSEGYFGFLGWQDSGEGGCEFKNSWIWSLD